MRTRISIAVVLVVLLVVLRSATVGHAQTQQPPPGVTTTTVQRHLATIMPGSYFTAGCILATVPTSASIDLIPCAGVVVAQGQAIPVSQPAATVGPLTGGDGFYWLALHVDTTTVVPGWTRQSGTHYLWAKGDTAPTLVSSALVAKLLVAGGVMTDARDFRTPSSYVRNGTYDVTDPLYGGVADDTTDIGPALQQAVRAAGVQRAARVSIPKGRYALNSSVIVDTGVVIEGARWSPSIAMNQSDRAEGTFLHIRSTGFRPFVLQHSGAGLTDLAFDHEQPDPAPGWVPVDYDYTIVITHPTVAISDITLENLYFYRATRGIAQISVGDVNSGRVHIRQIFGQFFTTGIYLDYLLDITRVYDIHMWPFWSGDANVLGYQAANLASMVIGRCDGCYVENFFSFSSYYGLYFQANAHGGSAGFTGKTIQLDGVNKGVFVDQSGSYGWMVNVGSNPHAGVTGVNSGGLVVFGINNYWTFVNVETVGFDRECVLADGSGNQVVVTNIRCVNFNTGGAGAVGVYASSGSNISLDGYQLIVAHPSHPSPSYGGTFTASMQPGGAVFGPTTLFRAYESAGVPILQFANLSSILFDPGTQRYTIAAEGGTYTTGGVKRYLCIQDGVLTVGTSCP